MPAMRRVSSHTRVVAEPSADPAQHPVPNVLEMQSMLTDSFKTISELRGQMSSQADSRHWEDASHHFDDERYNQGWGYGKSGGKSSSKGGSKGGSKGSYGYDGYGNFKGQSKGHSKGHPKGSSSRAKSSSRPCSSSSRAGRTEWQQETEKSEIDPAYVYAYNDGSSTLRCVMCKKDDNHRTDAYIKRFLKKHNGVDIELLMTKMQEVAESKSEEDTREGATKKPHTVENVAFWCLNDGETVMETRFVVRNPAGLAVMLKLQVIADVIAKFKKANKSRGESILAGLEGFSVGSDGDNSGEEADL